MKNYAIVHVPDVEAVPCPCGTARRAFVDDPDQIASLHVVDIASDAKTHYHKKMTEIYYILAGTGQMELDGELVDVGPGDSVLIKPGCRHRAIGKLKVLNVPIPAFDPSDEWFDTPLKRTCSANSERILAFRSPIGLATSRGAATGPMPPWRLRKRAQG